MLLPGCYHVLGYVVVEVESNTLLNHVLIYFFQGPQIIPRVFNFTFFKKFSQKFELSFKQLLVEIIFVHSIQNQIFPLLWYVLNTFFELFHPVFNFQARQYIFKKFCNFLFSSLFLINKAYNCAIRKTPSHEVPIPVYDFPTILFTKLVFIITENPNRIENRTELMPSLESHSLVIFEKFRKNPSHACISCEVFKPFLHF